MAAFGGGDIGVAFFAFLCADTDGSAVRERLFFPLFLAGDGEVGEAVFGDGKLCFQAGFFGAGAVVTAWAL